MGNDDSFKWRSIQHPIERYYGRQKPHTTVAISSPEDNARQRANTEFLHPTPVQLPPHLFIPAGAESLDIRVAADISAGSIQTQLMSFKCPKGATCHFISYAVFSDGTTAALQQFVPKVDGRRVFPYQGDPNDSFKINLGLAPDLSNNSLIQCQLGINPDETIAWFVDNTHVVDIAMGVRMVGYIDYTQKRINARTGG